MTSIEWASVLIPAGLVVGAVWRAVANWRELDRWLVRTIELL